MHVSSKKLSSLVLRTASPAHLLQIKIWFINRLFHLSGHIKSPALQLAASILCDHKSPHLWGFFLLLHSLSTVEMHFLLRHATFASRSHSHSASVSTCIKKKKHLGESNGGVQKIFIILISAFDFPLSTGGKINRGEYAKLDRIKEELCDVWFGVCASQPSRRRPGVQMKLQCGVRQTWRGKLEKKLH